MTWRLAHSLVTLRAEVNQWAPNRRKASDGTLGDPAHASRASRHNPNRYGVVTALDITHDPTNGCDVHALARRLVLSPHPELAYIISDGMVAKSRTGFRWERYTGSNPHTLHAHFAVGVGPDSDPLPPYDSTRRWGVIPDEEDDMPLTPEDIDKVAAAVWGRKVPTTGDDQPAKLVLRDIFHHARVSAAKQLDVGALAEQLAARLPAAQGPVKVTDLEEAMRNVLGSLDEP